MSGTFKLRAYQEKAVKAAVKYLLSKQSKKPGILVAPVAAGKSLIIGSIVSQLDAPAVILQPSKEILTQNVEKAISFNLSPTIYSASCKKKVLSNLTYATLGSVKGLAAKLRDEYGIRYIIIDEVHSGFSAEENSMFMRFINAIGDVKVLGVTATPCRLHTYSSLVDGNYSKLNFLTKDDPHYFENVVHVVQVKEMIDGKFWSPVIYERWLFNESDLELNSTGAEYTNESIQKAIKKNGINNTIYLRILQLMNERRSILVCMDSIESCVKMKEFVNNKFGYISDAVTAKTSAKERDSIVEAFKNGEIRIVFNFSALSTGFDFPELDCVIFGRPTFSYSVYYQVYGRGVRIHKNKKDCLFIDCCGNYDRFGRPESLSIEQFPEHGWCMFSGDLLISGIQMGSTVTRRELQERADRIRKAREIRSRGGTPMVGGGTTATAEHRRENGRLSHPKDDMIMWFGKFEGVKLGSIPLWYLKYIAENMRGKNKRIDEIINYYLDITV